MALKIKWNDDRLAGTTTAVLLLCRERLARGDSQDLIQAALAEYRADPDGYKAKKATWPPVTDVTPVRNAAHAAHYQKLLAAVERMLRKFVQTKRQFNSLTELDNFLVSTLRGVR